MTGRSSARIRRIASSDATFASRVDELGARPAVARRRPRVALAEERQLAVDVVERPLGAVEQDEPRRVEVEDLARQLGADRAAGARDEHGPAARRVAETALVR